MNKKELEKEIESLKDAGKFEEAKELELELEQMSWLKDYEGRL